MLASVIAVGVPSWPASSGGFDWKPLLMFLVALLLMRLYIGLRLTWPTAAAAFVAGTLWGWLIDAWGILMPTALMMSLALAASFVIERSRT